MSNLYGTLPIDNVIDLREAGNLPVPSGGNHVIPADTTIYLNGKIDLGSNNLTPLGNLNIFGNGNFNSSLTSSNASGTVDLGTNLGSLNLTNMICDNTNAANIALAIDNAGSSIICERVNFFADWVIGNCQFLDMERVTHIDNSVRFTKAAPAGSFSASISAFIQTSPGPFKSIVFEPGASLNKININLGVLFLTSTGGVGIEVENPDSINSGELDSINIAGTGTLLRCNPVSSSNFTVTTVGAAITGIAFDGNGNLIIADLGTNTFSKMVGKTNVVDSSIVAPALNTRGVTWLKGNLYSLDEVTNLIYKHVGFSNIIDSTITTPGTAGAMLTNDGTNIISTDFSTNLVYVHDGFSTAILDSFSTPAGANLSGVAHDGVNLLVTSDADHVVFVLKGMSETEQYSFPIPAASNLLFDIVVTDTGLAATEFNPSNIVYLFDHPVTFDHSSRTWELIGLAGNLVESADRGGSQFTDPAAVGFDVATDEGIWTDISDDGANIFYGSFSAMEKCRLNNELNGEIIWTGASDRGRVLSGLVIITRGGSAANRFYQIGIAINGVIQRDSIASAVLPDSSAFVTFPTLPVTRDLTKDDLVKLQIRNVTDGVDPRAVSSKTSIN